MRVAVGAHAGLGAGWLAIVPRTAKRRLCVSAVTDLAKIFSARHAVVMRGCVRGFFAVATQSNILAISSNLTLAHSRACIQRREFQLHASAKGGVEGSRSGNKVYCRHLCRLPV